MIWLAGLLVILVPVGIYLVVARDEQHAELANRSTAWIRRLWLGSRHDRRHCHRYEAAIHTTYCVLPNAAPIPQGVTRDISMGGVGLVLHEKLTPGMEIELKLQCAAPTGAITVTGTVQWVREVTKRQEPPRVFWTGIRVLHTSMASIDQFQAVLERLAKGEPRV